MKKLKTKMTIKEGKLEGGFNSLNDLQLSKIKGGMLKKDINVSSCDGNTNGQLCTNTQCGLNESC